MTQRVAAALTQWKTRHAALWQLIMYALVGCVASTIELVSFALCNFLIFPSLHTRSVSIWLIVYTAADGGMTAFLSHIISYTITQVFTFIAQRKATFKSVSKASKSAIIYTAMIIVLYLLQLYLPTVIRAPLAGIVGEGYADMLTKLIAIFCTTLVQFPMSKYVIMR